MIETHLFIFAFQNYIYKYTQHRATGGCLVITTAVVKICHRHSPRHQSTVYWRCCDLPVQFIKFPNKQKLCRARFKVNPWTNLTANVWTDCECAVEALLDACRRTSTGACVVYSMQGPHLMTVLNDGCVSAISRSKQRKYVVGLIDELIIADSVHFIHLRTRAVRCVWECVSVEGLVRDNTWEQKERNNRVF